MGRRKDARGIIGATRLGPLGLSLLAALPLTALAALPMTAHAAVKAQVSTAIPTYDHIFFVIDENRARTQVIGPAPYLTGLATANAQSSTYNAVIHPSVNNYLALFSGQTYANINDQCTAGTGTCHTTAPNLADEVLASGRTTKGYMESMPSPCWLQYGPSPYTMRHNPFPYFDQIRTNPSRCANMVPYSQLATDLASAATTPSYAWITPNLQNDMHNGSVAMGDAWAQANFPAIFNSPAWKTQHSLLMFTLDEDDGSASNNVPFFAVSSDGTTRTNYTSTVPATHYSALRTIEASWGLATLTANDAAASPMSDLFTGSRVVPGAVAGTVLNATSGTGVPGATVTDTGGAATTTDGAGAYTLPGLAPGVHTLTASGAGFGSASRTATVVSDQVVPGADFSLSGHAPPPGPHLVQASGATEAAAATTLTATLPALSAAGNLLVLSASMVAGATSQVTLISDSAGGIWTRGGEYLVSGHSSRGELWYTMSPGAVSSVTIHFASAVMAAFAIQEYSGVAAAPFEGSAGTANSGVAAASGPLTPAAPGDLVVGFVAGHLNLQALNVTAPGFTTQVQQTTTTPTGAGVATVVSGFEVASSATAQDFTGTFASSMYWAAGIAAFRAGAGGPPPATTGAVTGRVSSTGGVPIAGAQVSDPAGNSTYTDAAGFYTLVGINPGSVAVTAADAGYSSQTTAFTTIAGETTQSGYFSLAPLPPGAVSGTVTGLAGGAPIPGATVADDTGHSTLTDGAGAYMLTGLSPGSRSLTASAPGLNTAFNSALVTSGRTTTNVNFVLAPTPGAVTGSVTNVADGLGIAGATVTDSTGASASADALGVYTLIGLSPGSHTVTASGVAYVSQTIVVSVLAGVTSQNVNFSLTSAPPGSLSGVVTRIQDGAPVPGATLSAAGVTAVIADGSGQYTLTGLSPGPHTVTAFAPGYVVQSQSALVVANQATSGIDFTIAPAASGGPKLLQAAGTSESVAALSLSGSFSTPTAAGHLLVLSASIYAGATTGIVSITDSGGNAWTRIGSYSVPGHNSAGEIWYATNAASVRGLTVNLRTAAVAALQFQEFSGVATSAPLDCSTGTANLGLAAASGPVTPTAAGDLVVGFIAGHSNAQPISLSGPAYIDQTQQTSIKPGGYAIASVVSGYEVPSSVTATKIAASLSPPMYWSAGVACFKAGA